MKILITGATGYIGGRLVAELLEAGHQIRCLARNPAKLEAVDWRTSVEVVKGDLDDRDSLDVALKDIDVAYYLIHSMGDVGTKDFQRRDNEVAARFRDAAAEANVKRLIYLGGLGEDSDQYLSTHLRSRHEVGAVLADGPVATTELRAAIIVGSGSASFEMLRNLVEMLPIMVTPKWVRTRCQPIAVRDALHYLVAVLENPDTADRIIEIGGPDVLTYAEMMNTYADVIGMSKRILIPVPVLTPKLSSLWIGLVTPLPTGIAKPLVEGLASEVIVHDDAAQKLMPHECIGFREAIERAVKRTRDLEVTTTWAGAENWSRSPADPVESDPDWSGGTVLDDERATSTVASATSVFKTVSGLGGSRGWLVAHPLWAIRGWIDKSIGGVGMRRGRRHPDDLRVGDTVDFWRVEALVPDKLLRLKAEMKLPGRAWLEWTISEDDEGKTHLVQRARFQPRGLWGRAYWYALFPFHAIIFKGLVLQLAHRAEEAERA